jgi:hypothetical protein
MAPSRKRTAKESASEHRLRIGCFMGGFSSATIPKMPAAANEKRPRELFPGAFLELFSVRCQSGLAIRLSDGVHVGFESWGGNSQYRVRRDGRRRGLDRAYGRLIRSHGRFDRVRRRWNGSLRGGWNGGFRTIGRDWRNWLSHGFRNGRRNFRNARFRNGSPDDEISDDGERSEKCGNRRNEDFFIREKGRKPAFPNGGEIFRDGFDVFGSRLSLNGNVHGNFLRSDRTFFRARFRLRNDFGSFFQSHDGVGVGNFSNRFDRRFR